MQKKMRKNLISYFYDSKHYLLKYKNFVCKCTIGKKGIKSGKREGDNITPRGTFSLGKIYYRKDRVKKTHHRLKDKKNKKKYGMV